MPPVILNEAKDLNRSVLPLNLKYTIHMAVRGEGKAAALED
jgi:hypothetical protein